jgi:aconitate hydratase
MDYFHDEETVKYLRATGRSEVMRSFREIFPREVVWDPSERRDRLQLPLELDLSDVKPSVAGPKRPQDRIELPASSGPSRVVKKPIAEGSYGNLMERSAPKFKSAAIVRH